MSRRERDPGPRRALAGRSDAGRVHVLARRRRRAESKGLPRAESRGDRDILELSVADDGPGIDPQAAAQAGHGIANTRERLRALYGDRASLVVERSGVAGTTGTIATLRVPYVPA